MDINGNTNGDTDAICELKNWLFERVADDNDIVVDEMQKEFEAYFDQKEAEHHFPGSEEYQKNVKYLNTTIAELKTPEGKQKIKIKKDKQKITDGIRSCWYAGNVNKDKFPHGEGIIAYDNKDAFRGVFDNGILDREGKLSYADQGGLKVEGKWQDGLMEGEMRIDTYAGGWIEGYYHHGVAHGFQRELGTRESSYAKNPSLRFLGRFYRGVARGFCWKGCFGGGFLCGFVDPKDGSFSGNDLAFIYPDFKTVLRGQFKNGLLVKGQICSLIGSKCEKGIFIPTFTKPEGQVYEYEEPSKKVMAKNPLIAEPWETRHVYVKESNLPQGGEGLFAKESMTKGSLLAFYNGIRLNTASVLLEQRYGHSDYRCRLNAETDLDLPKGFESLGKYCATLAHKANHSFESNCEWILFEHPRFGLIRGIRATYDVPQDAEILVNYSINLADSPEWYRILWIRNQRDKGVSDATIKRLVARYEENSCKKVEIPDSEELVIPEPHGLQNIDDIPEDSEIEQNTIKAQIIELQQSKKKPEIDEEDMLPKVEEIV